MSDLSEEKLIEKAKYDPQAFELLFEKYYSPILNYTLRRVGEVAPAQDITSDVFFIVFKKISQFKWRNIPFSAWIYRIASNEIAYYFRKNKVRNISLDMLLESSQWEPVGEYGVEEELKSAEAELKEHRQFLLLQKAIQNLSLKYQEVICLKYFEGKKIKEISVILGKKENTIKSLLKRGREILEKEVHSDATFFLTQH